MTQLVGYEALDARELRGFHLRLTFLSAAGMFLDGYDLTVIAVALPFVSKQFAIPAALQGLVGSSAVIGMLVGSLFLGRLTDSIGRRTMYLVDLLFFVVFAVLAAVSQNVWQLILFRILLGLGIGADYPISSTLLAEFSPTGRRGRLVTALGATWFVGALVAYLVGMAFLPLGGSAWRWMLLMGALFALVVLTLRREIPESPRWLQARGRDEEASAVVRQVTGRADVQLDVAPSAPGRSWLELFSKSLIRATIFGCGFWFAYDVAFYGISIYTPTILSSFTHGSTLNAYAGSAAVALLGLIGAGIGLVLVDGWGRRPLIITSFAGLTVSLVALALFPSPAFIALVVLFAAAELFANMGPGVLDFVYLTELFPTGLRASGSGLGTAVSRVGAILGILVFPNLVKAWGLGGALWLFVAAAVLGLVVSVLLAPETKDVTLERISGGPFGGTRPVVAPEGSGATR
ncbi:MAG: MFS transporter [Chloroflexi bacterium]|nr:MFS transporter [Chloroflexota bacterium]